jgi:two-component system, cell cycle sensor histidine kinase PleC
LHGADKRICGMTSSYDKTRLAFDELRIVANNLKPNVVMMPLLAALISLMFSQWVPHSVLFVWCGLVLVAVFPLHFVSRRFSQTEQLTSPTRWTAIFCVAIVTFELAWGSLAVLLWVPNSDFDHVLILLLLGSTIAGNCVLAGASSRVTLTAFLVYGPAMVLTPLRSGGMVYDTLSVVALVYIVFLLYMAHVYHDVSRGMLLLREEKKDLIERLEIALADAQSARERAEGANRAKSQFLASMSHELRTPLNAILGFSELITMRVFGDDPDRQVQYAGLVHGAGRHLLSLIDDVLDLAKIEAGRLELHEREIDLPRLIEEALTFIAPKAAAAGSALASEFGGDLPLVVCDERALKQVLLNLLSNAVKFTPAGGTITSFARMTDQGDLEFGVRDTGVGIAAEDLGRAFEKFGQGRHDALSGDKGTGLGLPIVKGLVELHGGAITLESAVGKGTCATITLPATRLRDRRKQAS